MAGQDRACYINILPCLDKRLLAGGALCWAAKDAVAAVYDRELAKVLAAHTLMAGFRWL